VRDLRQQVESELLSDILPFWLKYTIDEEHGGFRGLFPAHIERIAIRYIWLLPSALTNI